MKYIHRIMYKYVKTLEKMAKKQWSSLFSCVVITKEKLLFTVKVKALLNVCIHSLLQTRK